jgi:hypothetical protein
MILADIRIQFILSLFGILALAGALMPDRYGRWVSKFVMIGAGFLAFGFLAMAPEIHADMGPLPTGAAANGNVWVWLAEFRDRPSALSLAALGSYAAAGLVWAIAHFWLYARRLGQVYVMERDAWLRARNQTDLNALSADERLAFQQVLTKVKREMLYTGDFPLAPLQQKRFFIANSMLWPVTLLYYLLADLSLDAARYVWFALRNWIHRRWEAGMAEYLADDATCRAYIAEKSPAAQAG